MKNINYLFTLCCFMLLFCISCAEGDAAFSPDNSDTGTGGSYARFIVNNNRLYVIDLESIKTFSLDDPVVPFQINHKEIGSNIESLFRLDNRLFIGSGSGLYIYEIDADGIPQPKGQADYDLPFEPCDPVVATNEYAYVTLNTLNSTNSCGRVTLEEVNVLKIFNIQEIERPQLIAEYPMYNPKGVGIDNNTLFLCDDREGLKIYDVENPQDIRLIKQFDSYTAFDVIPLDGLLLVVATDNIYQYDYTNLDNIQLVSQIPIAP